MRRRTVLGLGALALGGGWTWAGYRSDMAAVRAGRTDPSGTIPTRFGQVEWAEAGSGAPLLILHGTGGGYDQGLLFARRLSRGGWRVIAPSRFGYLGSDCPENPTPADQADALAELLDHLGIARLPVLGGSAGAISAIEFAIRHPARCAALVPIVPAAYAPNRPPMRPDPGGAAVMRFGLRSDFLFWAGIGLAEDRMIATLLATDPALVHAAPPDERARVRAILRGILPVSARARGLLVDAAQAGNPSPQALDRVRAPTLAISLEDDRFLTADAARHIAAYVAGARLLIYPTGGHVWVGHDAELFGAVAAFLRGLA
ncbi:MAG: alpha/beta fold hydrolase [Paracoccaceae bacterium]